MKSELLEPPETDEQPAEHAADSGTARAPPEDATSETSTVTVGVETADGTATVSLPPTATREEAAAIAAALSVHLDEDDTDEEPTPVDRWKLSGRLGRNGHGRERARSPRQYSRGSEWKFANRVR